MNTLSSLKRQVAVCQRCELGKQRKRTVFGQGNGHSPDILFVGEGPGETDEAKGRSFAGPAGRLLTKLIAGMGYTRKEVFIANICKCHPPNNRLPMLEETQACLPWLREQIAIIQPAVADLKKVAQRVFS